jgi:MSHA biogenesis protein MshO
LNDVAGVGTTTTVRIISNNSFPFDSPSHSFQVVDMPVTYICDGGVLRRYWGYAIKSSQADTDSIAKLDALVTPPNTGSSAVLAQNVTTCVFTYDPGITERSGLVSMQLTITQGGEKVTLYHQVHVSNAP